MKKNFKLDEMTMEELLQYEKGARLWVTKYEKESFISRNDSMYGTNNEIEKLFNKYNTIHHKILEEIKSRLDNID